MTRATTTWLLLLAAVLLLAPTPAWAGGKQDIIAGNAAARAGNFKKAIALFTRAIQKGKLSRHNLAIAYNNRGSAWDDLGQADRAIADYNRALKLKPDYAEAYYNRSFAYEKKGLIRLALADIQKAVRLAPNDPDYLQRLEYLNSLLARPRP